MPLNIGGGGANKGETSARAIMPSGGGRSSVVEGANSRAPKGPGKMIGGPSPEYRQTNAGTKRYDLGDKSISRGRRM